MDAQKCQDMMNRKDHMAPTINSFSVNGKALFEKLAIGKKVNPEFNKVGAGVATAVE